MNKKRTLHIITVVSLKIFILSSLTGCAILSALDNAAAANQPPAGYGVLTIDNKTQLSINMVEVKGITPGETIDLGRRGEQYTRADNTNFTKTYQVNIRPGSRAEIGEPISDYKAVVLPVGGYELKIHWSDGQTRITRIYNQNVSEYWEVWVIYAP